MTLPTHVLAGLIIGKITGDFPAALAGSLVMDLDHFVSYVRHGVLSSPSKFVKTIINEGDPWSDQRNFLHNIFAWAIVSALLMNFQFGSIFSLAYFVHLILDAIDGADFWPFFPSQKIVMRGPIPYCSKQEAVFSVILLVILIVLFVK